MSTTVEHVPENAFNEGIRDKCRTFGLFASTRPLIKPHQAQLVPTHKAQSNCYSPFYVYIMSPMCDYFVSFLPTWLAPNLITISGFMLLVFAHVLMVFLYGTSNEGPIDSWFCVLAGVSFFTYCTLDNMDGKQARRTKSGSPMGMLFDHGCDAITAINFNMVIQRVMQVGGGPAAMFCAYVSTLPFYIMTLEEFYTGVLTLPAYSGPDEAAFAILVFMLVTAYLGSEELWAAEIDVFGFGSMRTSHIFGAILFSFEGIQNLFAVFTNLWHSRNDEHFQKRFEPKMFIAHCSYIFILCGLYFGYSLVPGSQAATVYTRTMVLAYGGQFCQVILRMLVSSVIQDIFNPYRRTILAGWALMIGNAAHLLMTGKSFMNEGLLFGLINALSWGASAHYVYYVLQEFCQILDIYIFTIKQKPIDEPKKTK